MGPLGDSDWAHSLRFLAHVSGGVSEAGTEGWGPWIVKMPHGLHGTQDPWTAPLGPCAGVRLFMCAAYVYTG